MSDRQLAEKTTIESARYLRVGWALLIGSLLALAVPILITAAQPHVLWLFSMSHGAVAMVVGFTLIRVGQHPERAGGERRGDAMAGFR